MIEQLVAKVFAARDAAHLALVTLHQAVRNANDLHIEVL